MKSYMVLIVFNIALIIFSIGFFLLSRNAWVAESFLQKSIYSLIAISVIYVSAWSLLGLLCKKNKIKRSVQKQDVWMAMLPNGLVVVALIIMAVSSHIGFIYFVLSQIIFVSIFIIPFLFFGLANIEKVE